MKTLTISVLLLLLAGTSFGAAPPVTSPVLATATATTQPAAQSPYEARSFVAGENAVDRLVFPRLKTLRIEPANPCSDAVFVRRVYLDVTGTLPTADEARKFIEDKSKNKRTALIEKLLERDEFVEYWTMKWADLLRVKSEFPINLWPNAVQAYQKWIWTSVRDDKPLDDFARELLTASGSNFRDPPANFYRALQEKTPRGLAQAVALTFMGSRLESWPKDRQEGLAAFFSQVSYKYTAEWKEEIVYFDPTKAISGTPMFPDGTRAAIPAGKDPRTVFADWLLKEQNPYFAKSMANRAWYWLMGRGIVHEPDDMRADNPPVNPELLALLEKELVKGHYNIKPVFRLILNSRTYQLSSIARSNDPRGEANFARYPLRRLDAEVLIDAICGITGTTEKYTSQIPEPFTFIPEENRSISLADGSINSAFLELFGRSPRDLGTESERANKPSPSQRLHMLNSSHVQRKLEQGPRMQALLRSRTNTRDLAMEIYLAFLSRYPTSAELNAIEGYSKSGVANVREVGIDIAWTLVNSSEFLYRH